MKDHITSPLHFLEEHYVLVMNEHMIEPLGRHHKNVTSKQLRGSISEYALCKEMRLLKKNDDVKYLLFITDH